MSAQITWKEFYFLFCYKTKTTREMKTTFGTHDQTSYKSKSRERSNKRRVSTKEERRRVNKSMKKRKEK